MIEDLCKKLKEQRQHLHLTLEEVVDKTKLAPSVIHAIEECQLEQINTTYLKGFIKIYANFLNIDVGPALQDVVRSRSGQKATSKEQPKAATSGRFQSQLKPKKYTQPSEKKPISISLPKDSKPRVPPNAIKLAISILICGLVLWIGVSITKFFVNKISKWHQQRKQYAAQQQAQTPEAGSSRSTGQQPVRGTLRATLSGKKTCLLRVEVDGKLLFEGILKKGAVETWEGKKSIDFRISDGSAVLLQVNGKSYPSLTSLKKPIKSLKITQKGITVTK